MKPFAWRHTSSLTDFGELRWQLQHYLGCPIPLAGGWPAAHKAQLRHVGATSDLSTAPTYDDKSCKNSLVLSVGRLQGCIFDLHRASDGNFGCGTRSRLTGVGATHAGRPPHSITGIGPSTKPCHRFHRHENTYVMKDEPPRGCMMYLTTSASGPVLEPLAPHSEFHSHREAKELRYSTERCLQYI